MEKIINEIKVIETEEGYRIEIKGNKEAIRRMLSGFGAFNYQGKGQGFNFGFWPGCWGGWWNPWEEPKEKKPGEI